MKLALSTFAVGLTFALAGHAFASDTACKAVDPATNKTIASASSDLLSKCSHEVRQSVKRKSCVNGTKQVKYRFEAVYNGKAVPASERIAYCDPSADEGPAKDDAKKDDSPPPVQSNAKEGDRASITAYQTDGKTVIAVVACSVGSLGPEYPACLTNAKDRIKPQVCSGKKGRQSFKYKMGNITTILSDAVDCGS